MKYLIFCIALYNLPSLAVDLTYEQVQPLGQETPIPSDQPVYGKRWFERTDISGYLAFVYARTGAAGSRPNGSFNNKQASIQFDSEIDNDLSVSIETRPFGVPHGLVSEANIQWQNLIRGNGENRLSMKVGKFSVPYGEEYLTQWWDNNPFISDSAIWPWGFDTGLMFYGSYDKWSWVTSITDGKLNSEKDSDNDTPHSTGHSLKFSRQISPTSYVSYSHLYGGPHKMSTMWYGNNWFAIGGGPNGAGTNILALSTHTADNLTFIQKWSGLKLKAAIDMIDIHSLNDSSYNRTLRAFTLEPIYAFAENWYLGGRYSTVNSGNGYPLGNSTDDGNYFGFCDATTVGTLTICKGTVKKFSLTALAVGYNPNPKTGIVAEVTAPEYEMISSSTKDPENKKHLTWAARFLCKF